MTGLRNALNKYGTRAPKKRPEEDLQKQVVRFLTACRPDCIWFATTNQKGTRTAIEMGILKAMGARAGVPDLVFALPGAQLRFIELKAPKRVQSPAQEQFQAECEAMGVPYLICRSLPEVEGALNAWGVTLKARIAA